MRTKTLFILTPDNIDVLSILKYGYLFYDVFSKLTSIAEILMIHGSNSYCRKIIPNLSFSNEIIIVSPR